MFVTSEQVPGTGDLDWTQDLFSFGPAGPGLLTASNVAGGENAWFITASEDAERVVFLTREDVRGTGMRTASSTCTRPSRDPDRPCQEGRSRARRL